MASDDRKLPPDPTSIISAPTDIAPRTSSGPKPAHEWTVAEDVDVVNWSALAASKGFKELIRAKRRFIIPATIFFVVYYFALPVLVGYARPFMETRVFGAVNIAYLFALSQFFVAWFVAALYVRAAGKFDRMAADVIKHEKQ